MSQANDKPDVPDLDLEYLIGYNLKRAYMITQADFRATLGEGGLAPREFSALALVVQMPDITQSEVSRLLGIERSGLVAIIDRLEHRSYVARVPVPGDRRIQALSPTPDGIAVYERAVASVKAHEAKLFATLSTAEQKQLVTLLKKFRAAKEERP